MISDAAHVTSGLLTLWMMAIRAVVSTVFYRIWRFYVGIFNLITWVPLQFINVMLNPNYVVYLLSHFSREMPLEKEYECVQMVGEGFLKEEETRKRAAQVPVTEQERGRAPISAPPKEQIQRGKSISIGGVPQQRGQWPAREEQQRGFQAQRGTKQGWQPERQAEEIIGQKTEQAAGPSAPAQQRQGIQISEGGKGPTQKKGVQISEGGQPLQAQQATPQKQGIQISEREKQPEKKGIQISEAKEQLPQQKGIQISERGEQPLEAQQAAPQKKGIQISEAAEEKMPLQAQQKQGIQVGEGKEELPQKKGIQISEAAEQPLQPQQAAQQGVQISERKEEAPQKKRIPISGGKEEAPAQQRAPQIQGPVSKELAEKKEQKERAAQQQALPSQAPSKGIQIQGPREGEELTEKQEQRERIAQAASQRQKIPIHTPSDVEKQVISEQQPQAEQETRGEYERKGLQITGPPEERLPVSLQARPEQKGLEQPVQGGIQIQETREQPPLAVRPESVPLPPSSEAWDAFTRDIEEARALHYGKQLEEPQLPSAPPSTPVLKEEAYPFASDVERRCLEYLATKAQPLAQQPPLVQQQAPLARAAPQQQKRKGKKKLQAHAQKQREEEARRELEQQARGAPEAFSAH